MIATFWPRKRGIVFLALSMSGSGLFPVVLEVEREAFAPSEAVVVEVRGVEDLPAKAWVGMVPAEIPHGDARENDRHDRQYRYLKDLDDGQLTFNPLPEGAWTARLNLEARELASSSSFTVSKTCVPPGQLEPGVWMERTEWSRGEKPVVSFSAPAAYPDRAWIGIVPAETPHGSSAENDKADVQYRFLEGETEGELAFHALKPGDWSARLFAWGIESASVDFRVGNEVVPPGEEAPALVMERGVIGAGESFSVEYTIPEVYPNSAWVGIIPADVPHGDNAVNDQHDVQWFYLNEGPRGLLTFRGLPAGEWSARISVWETESASVPFTVVEGTPPPGGPVASTAPDAEGNGRETEPGADGPESVPGLPSEDDPGPVAGNEEPVDQAPAAAGYEPEAEGGFSPVPNPVVAEWIQNLPSLPVVPPVRLTPTLDLGELTGEAYAGLVSHAREGLAELTGPMTAPQQAAYDAAWEPMFRFPAPECIAYLEAVSPMIDDTLRLRLALAEQLARVEEKWLSAGYAELYDPEAAMGILESSLPDMALVKAIREALVTLANRLDSLGDPPDPGALQAEAAKQHHAAMRNLESLLLGQPELEGYFEQQQLVQLAEMPLGGEPFYKVEHAPELFITRAITPMGGSRSDLVLFSQYVEVEAAGDSMLGIDFDIDPWSAWYAEPTTDGWARYDYDPEDEWLDVTFYRPETDRLVVDTYSVFGGMIEGERRIFHRAPLEAAPRVYGDAVDPEDPGAFIRANREAAAEAEADFRRAKEAYLAFIERRGPLPVLPDPDDVHWVLKDIATKQEEHSRNKGWAYGREGISDGYTELEQFDFGPNHLSAAWKSVDLEWVYRDAGAPIEVPEGSAYIPDPDSEDIGGGSVMVPVETIESRGATVQWTAPPAVLRDSANWLMDPRTEGGEGVAFGVEMLVTEDRKGFGMTAFPDLSFGFLGGGSRGLQLTRSPFHADERPSRADEEEAGGALTAEKAAAHDLVLSLRSLRFDKGEVVVPVLVTTPAAYLRIDYTYEQRVMTPGEALAVARDLDGSLAVASLSEARRSTSEGVASVDERIKSEAEAAALDRERRAFHEANIAWNRQEVGRLENEIEAVNERLRSGNASEADVQRLNQLRFRLVNMQSNIVSEQDRIRELATGELVHSRTPFDDYCRVQMIEKCRDSVREFSAGERARRKAEFLIGKLDPAQQRNARRILERLISEGKGLYAGDYEELNTAMQDIYQGGQEQEQARIAEEVAWENAWVEGAEYVKAGADVGLAITSMGGGPMYVSVLYQAGSGYIDKGPKEALRRAIMTYSDAADVVISGYDGWKTGGAWGAVEGASFAILMNKGPEAALGRINMRLKRGSAFDGGFGKIEVAGKPVAEGPDGLRRIADGQASRRPVEGTTARADPAEIGLEGSAQRSRRGREAIEAGQMQQEMEWGEQLAKDAFSDYAQLRSAEIRGDMDPAELSALRMRVRQKMCAVGNSMTAKSYLKYQAPGRMGQAYTEVMDDVLDDAVTAYRMGMREMGYNDQRIVQYRNLSSKDAGMDADLGLVEQLEVKRVVGDDGNVTYEKTPLIVKEGQPVDLQTYQADGSRTMAEAYRKVSGGYSARGSFVELTTRVHGEAYRDLNWLKVPKAGAHSNLPRVERQIDAVFGRIDPDLTPQALGITTAKAEAMFHDHPELRPLESMMEASRGTAKDLETKFIPLVNSRIRNLEKLPNAERGPDVLRKLRELNQTKAHLDQCRNVFNQIGRGETHPGRWMKDFRKVTGGEDPIAVTARLASMTERASRM